MGVYSGDQGETINIVAWTFTTIATIVVGMRVISRGVLTKNFGLDDGLMVFSLLILIAYAIVLSIAVSKGEGTHFAQISPSERVEAAHFVIITSSVGIQTFSWPKLAIVALLHRILNLRILTRVIFWCLSISLVVFCLLASIFWFVQCDPIPSQWNPEIKGTCWSPDVINDYSYFCGAFSAMLDLLFAIYPPFIIYQLNMPTYKKIFLSCALGGGLVAAAVVFYKLSLVKEITKEVTLDPTWADAPLLMWTLIESVVLIIAASLPTIGPFIRVTAENTKRLYFSYAGSKNQQSYYGTGEEYNRYTKRSGPSNWTSKITNKPSKNFSDISSPDNVHLVNYKQDVGSNISDPPAGPGEIVKKVEVVESRDEGGSSHCGLDPSVYNFQQQIGRARI